MTDFEFFFNDEKIEIDSIVIECITADYEMGSYLAPRVSEKVLIKAEGKVLVDKEDLKQLLEFTHYNYGYMTFYKTSDAHDPIFLEDEFNEYKVLYKKIKNKYS